MRRTALIAAAVYGLTAYAQTGQQPTRPQQPPHQEPPKSSAGLYQRTPGSHPYQQNEDFFHFATKQVNPRDFDWGAWLEERRQAFLEASLANPFFWYSSLTTALLIILMSAYGVRELGEKRKLWRAAEILTDVWNDAEQARTVAQRAIEKHNRHMQECNRVVEAQVSGRSSATALDAADARKELERLQGELNNMDSDRKALQAKLEIKEKGFDELSSRLKALEKSGANSGFHPPAREPGINGHGESENKLIARINQLTQQLEAEKQKNRALKGA